MDDEEEPDEDDEGSMLPLGSGLFSVSMLGYASLSLVWVSCGAGTSAE